MIYGIGTDICDVRRIQERLDRHGERFAQTLLAPGECALWTQRSAANADRGLRYLATRFAAKEAFSKAIGLGMRLPMTWQHCEIVSTDSGQPTVVVHGALKVWWDERGLRAHMSLSDEREYVVAFCVVETP